MPLKVLFIESDFIQEYNSSNWRCIMPHRALLRAGYQSKVIRMEAFAQRLPEVNKLVQEADIIFYQRNVFHDIIQTLFQWRAMGKTIVIDLDDAYEYMTEETGSPSYPFWKHGRVDHPDKTSTTLDPLPIDVLKYGVKFCGMLSSPSKLICGDWDKYARTYWFPNWIDLSIYEVTETYRDPGAIHLGWGGSMTHLVSWEKSGAAEAVAQIIKENPKVKIVLLGDPRLDRVFKNVHKPNRLTAGWVPQAAFASKLSHFDIGLIPLYGEYDRRRSWIKTAEYSVLGVPWIGTDFEPNQDVNTGTRVKNTAEEWYKAIKFYLDNYAEVRDAAIKSRDHYREYFSIDNRAGELMQLFERIVEEDK